MLGPRARLRRRSGSDGPAGGAARPAPRVRVCARCRRRRGARTFRRRCDAAAVGVTCGAAAARRARRDAALLDLLPARELLHEAQLFKRKHRTRARALPPGPCVSCPQMPAYENACCSLSSARRGSGALARRRCACLHNVCAPKSLHGLTAGLARTPACASSTPSHCALIESSFSRRAGTTRALAGVPGLRAVRNNTVVRPE